MVYKFKLGHNIAEAIKNICCVKGEGTVDWFGFFVLWHINLCRLFNAKAILLEEQ